MTKKGIAVITGVLLVASALVAAIQVAAPASDTYTVTADVTQAPNLFEGGRVMVRGVEVGEIVDVEPRPDGVRLTFEIDSDVPVPADASLSVIPITVISDRYVQLVPAYKGGPKLADGDHIPLDRTSIPAELDDVLKQLKGLLSALEPRPGETTGPLTRLIKGLDRALKGRSDKLAGTLEGSATVLENLADSEARITGLITNLDKLFLALANRSSEIAIVNERFALVAEALLSDQGNLEGTIENLSLLADETAGLLSESGDDLGESFGRLARVLRVVLRHEDQLTRGIEWSNVISQALGAVDRNGRGKYAYTGRQTQPGTSGAEYNYRIETRDTIACERIEAVTETLVILIPDSTVDDILTSLLSYIPDEYDDDLAYLLRQLIPLCTDVEETPALDTEAIQTLREVKERVGEEKFTELLARFLAESYMGAES